MKIHCIGGGPGGLYFALLIKKALPDAEVVVHERNRPDDTFGWGVVFSDETLGGFAAADAESHAAITRSFRYWSEIETYFRGTCEVSSGHGFCGLARRTLLEILHERCRAVGVELRFETEVGDPRELRGADLIVGADGVNSRVRDSLAAHFEPSIEPRACKFAWFGTDKPLSAFTFIFEETEHGLFQVHAYPFAERLSTWIVECREEVWRRAGLERLDEPASLAWCERLFARFLGGHRLLGNRSVWRTFPTVRNRRWHHENVVLIGDAAHTAHFSIGSGTKLAMEDAVALAAAVAASPADVRSALVAYEAARAVPVAKIQRAAQTSLEWFENSARYLGQHPLAFLFNLMTRSKQITYDNLRKRDPQLVERVTEHFAREHGTARDAHGRAAPPMFAPLRLRGLNLDNRIVVSPMCQYSAADGTPGDWHLVHLGSRAVGGAGLVMTEMTDVCAEGRITARCTGMYTDAHVAAWQRIVAFVHGRTRAKIGIQLAHAGRKGSVRHPWDGEDVPLAAGQGWQTLAPSPIPFRPGWPVPRAMDRADMDAVRAAFVQAVHRAAAAGFDLVELHMAHGYLLSSFLSPLSNRRSDAYGGILENRLRFPLEVLRAARAAWPEHKPLAVRISATDWAGAAGLTADDAVAIAAALARAGCDLVDVSSGGNVADAVPEYGRMYQVPFAERIRYEVGVPVMAVGAILGADHCNTILAAGRADLCCLARPHLRDPYLTLRAAAECGVETLPWPEQYLPARPAPPPS